MDETQPNADRDSRSVTNTSNVRNRLPYYENVPELPRPGADPINNQQLINSHNQRPVLDDRYFTPNTQNNTPSNNIQGGVLTLEPQFSAQQLETLRMQSPELQFHYQNTPPTHRRSLDEITHLSYVAGEGRTNHVAPPNFVRQHRRGRSDEVARCIEGTSHMNMNVRFSSPPLVRAPPMVHSVSTSSLDQQQHHNFNHSLHHSASIDNATIYNSYVSDNMCLYHQNTAYVKLTTGINKAQRQLKDIEKEKETCERELNDLLSVQNNPTENDYRQLRNECNILLREISEMYHECDKMNISIDPERDFPMELPSTPLFRTPSPTKTQTTQMNTTFPYGKGEHLSPIITKHPLPPNYQTISNPFQQFHKLQPEGTVPDFSQSTSDVPRRPPLPILTRPLPFLHPTVPPSNFQPSKPPPGAHSHEEDEHWECPSCTFKNLLVAECEVCYTRRPAKNTRLS